MPTDAKQHLTNAFAASAIKRWSNAGFKPSITAKHTAVISGELILTATLAAKLVWSKYMAGPAPGHPEARPLSQKDAADEIINRTLRDNPLGPYGWKHGASDNWGFAAGDTHLGRFQLHLETQEHCGTCAGTASVTCRKCSGRGQHTCHCYTGRVICSICGGAGRTRYNYGTVACLACNSSGRRACSNCYGSGWVRCMTCGGGGNLHCQNCAATGLIHAIGWYHVDARVVPQAMLLLTTDSQRAWLPAIQPTTLPAVTQCQDWVTSKNQDSEVVLRAAFTASMSEGEISVPGLPDSTCAALGEPPLFFASQKLITAADHAEAKAAIRLVPTRRSSMARGLLARPYESPMWNAGAFLKVGNSPQTYLSLTANQAADPVWLAEHAIAKRWVASLRAHATGRKLRSIANAALAVVSIKFAIDIGMDLAHKAGLLDKMISADARFGGVVWPEGMPEILGACLAVMLIRRPSRRTDIEIEQRFYRHYQTAMLPFWALLAYLFVPRFL